MITKPEMTWWKGMIVMIVAVAIWAVRLESKVFAIQDKYETTISNLSEDIRIIRNTQIEIAQKLGIRVEY